MLEVSGLVEFRETQIDYHIFKSGVNICACQKAWKNFRNATKVYFTIVSGQNVKIDVKTNRVFALMYVHK